MPLNWLLAYVYTIHIDTVLLGCATARLTTTRPSWPSESSLIALHAAPSQENKSQCRVRSAPRLEDDDT